MTAAMSDVPPFKSEQDNGKTSVKETMEKLGQPVLDPFKSKQEPTVTRKSGSMPLNSLLRFSLGAERPQSNNSMRFGVLSHHSFFSRHNPHPHRVTHINGLNGMPVCTVNDDWHGNTPLSPHPLIKSQFPTTIMGRLGLPISIFQCNAFGDVNIPKPALAPLSEAWRDELREFSSKACFLAPEQPEQKKTEERRATQYSAQTGRIMPSCTPATSHRSSRSGALDRNKPNGPFQDKELLVLELLCQLLQTDSFCAIQQWLLCAGQKEKEFVLGMVQSVLGSSYPDYQQNAEITEEQLIPQTDNISTAPISRRSTSTRKRHKRYYLKKKSENIEEDQPDHIGSAEVLLIHRSKSPERPSNGRLEVSEQYKNPESK
ncbi:protein TBATA-like [Amblyraja radiata]|uniref:protein TBATA-like n=1 Tax=Amblyraja radiata TaxID=386614 RepID=UPI001402DE66|nr:protein TBATA-like [Amblyraja radiata]XP_032868663.1 protein TBATA-like [Amblyraja radiata]XP_032868665.1 protein TBATA-like [Amblyraja radiata]XP_032868666.1 protein TBATA-like [Amblyraja radiata]